MLCFLSTLEGVFLGGLLLLSFVVIALKKHNDKLKAQAKGLAPQDQHPQDRLRPEPIGFRSQAERMAAIMQTKAEPNPLDWLPSAQAVPAKPDANPLDWLGPGVAVVENKPEPVAAEKPNESQPERAKTSLIDRLMPHLKPALFALSIVIVWFGMASWYDNLNHYVPPANELVGDFRILYLKKTIGALLPLISAVGAALGLLFMIHPRYYIYLNGWTSTDYDFFTDLQKLDEPKRYRRVLVFGLLFGLLLLVSLYVLLHSSPQELTL